MAPRRERAAPRTLLGVAEDEAARCPACHETRLRRDNTTGVCGYCQARGVEPLVPFERLEDGPLLELPSSPPGARVVSPRRLRREVVLERERRGMQAAVLRAQLARPRVREHCQGGPRPCPFVGCRFHLFLDVTPAGGIQVNHPGVELEDLRETCALDVADRGGVTLEVVGELLGVTRERIRQMERSSLGKLEVLRKGFDA